MENKKVLKVRITILYIVYFAALLGGVIYNTGPQFIRGAQLGFKASGNMMQSLADDNSLRVSNIYIDIPATSDIKVDALQLDDDKNTSVTVYGSRFHFMVSQDSDLDEADMSVIFSSVGGSAAIYFTSLLLFGLSIAVIVLLFTIIHSLHRSVKNDLPLDKKCVWYTRIIGLILIVSDILSAWSTWAMAKGAARVLEGSEFTVNTSFTLDYYNLLLAVLVIFTAEIFSIGSKLGEEQKLTI